MIEFGLVLGYDTFGAVKRSIQWLKGRALVPLVVLNESGADYSDVLSEDLIVRSANVNRDHVALVEELQARMRGYAQREDWAVSVIANFQDRMWLCQLHLARHFSAACALDSGMIERTAIKPNLRFLTRATPWEVQYALLPEEFILHTDPFSYPPLAELANPPKDLIVKPVMGMGGQGVMRIARERLRSDLPVSARKVLDLQKSLYSDNIVCRFLELGPEPTQPVNGYVLVEEYIEGTEYSVEGVADDNCLPNYLIVQEKTRQEERPVFRDMEYLATHPCLSQTKPGECTEALLGLVGFKAFPFHIELKCSNGAWAKPIEFNPRMGGGSIVELLSVVHGVDVQGLALVNLVRRLVGSRAFVTTVLQPKPGVRGRLVEYRGLKKVEQQVDCVFVKKMVPEGTVIADRDLETYLLEFCVIGRNDSEAKRRAAQLLASVEVIIE